MLANVHSINTSQFKATTRQPLRRSLIIIDKKVKLYKIATEHFSFCHLIPVYCEFMTGVNVEQRAHTAPVTSSAKVFMEL